VKLKLTAYEADQLSWARAILAELNANLEQRGEVTGFGITAGTETEITVCACAAGRQTEPPRTLPSPSPRCGCAGSSADGP
jgi:hypothetical protein